MFKNPPPSSPSQGRVLRFRRSSEAGIPASGPTVQASDFAEFERDRDTDDYRHRMIMNAVAFLFVLVLIGAGLLLADTMAQMRRYQDCMLSGRRGTGCRPFESNGYDH